MRAAVIHNDTRGPDHNGVNAAVRPDRDHYFGRIWRIDHKKVEHIAARRHVETPHAVARDDGRQRPGEDGGDLIAQ